MSSFAQIQIGQDIDGPNTGGRFGESCSISKDGSIIAIGAPNIDTGLGLVQVFEYSSTTNSWMQLGSNLTGTSTMDFFGESVAMTANGQVLVVGSRTNYSDSGRADVFEFYNGNWTQKGSSIYGKNLGDWFGQSVAINDSGNIVAVGAPNNDDAGSDAGQVRVYGFINGDWTLLGNNINGESSLDQFGRSVSLSSDGEIVAIGAPSNDANSTVNNSGHVRVFEYYNGSWTPLGSEINGIANSWSGYSVSISNSGDTVAIGAPNLITEGGVSVYYFNTGSWTKIGSDIKGLEVDDNAGWSVSLSGDGSKIAVGAPNNDGPTYSNNSMGQVLVFELLNGNWYSLGQAIYGNDTENWSGESVTISDNGKVVGIGAVNANGSNIGNVRIFANASPFRINEFIDGLVVYPNPAEEKVSIQSGSYCSYKIVDFIGRELKRGQCNKQIDLTDLPSGSYQLILHSDEGSAVHTLQKI